MHSNISPLAGPAIHLLSPHESSPRVLCCSAEKAAEAEEDAVLEAQPSAAVQPANAFWDELLKAGYQDLQQAQMEALGKGKRERRQVSHCYHRYPPRLCRCLDDQTTGVSV